MTHPAATAPPPARRPGCIWYFVAVLIFIAGFVGMIVVMFVGLGNFESRDVGFAQVAVPGRSDVTIAKPGMQIVVHEHEFIVDGSTASTASPSNIVITMRSKASGQIISLHYINWTAAKIGSQMMTADVDQAGV